MAKLKKTVNIIGLISTILGTIVLVAASLFLHYYQSLNGDNDRCDLDNFNERCLRINFYIVAACLGIVAAVIQILSYFFVWKKLLVPFALVLIADFLLCVVAFGLAIDRHVLDTDTVDSDTWIYTLIFLGFLGIDMLFALGAAIGIWMQSRKE